jgi:predicted PurR-regulated permease PerM
LSNAAIARAVAITALGGLILVALYIARDAILIAYISVVLAIGLGPLVHRIEQAVPKGARALPRWFAILIIYLGVVLLLTFAGLLVVPPLIDQARDLWGRAPQLLDQGQEFLIRHRLLSHHITLEEAFQNAPGPGDTMGTITSALTVAFGGIIAVITILILTFYLLVDSDKLFAAFARLFPRGERTRVEEVAGKISTKVSAWLSGQMILAGVIGVTSAIGLYFLGVPYFYVLALVTAIGEMIPMVGPILSALPCLAVAITVSPRTAIFTALFLLAQQQFEAHALVPKVMERQVGVSAVTVIIALLTGASLLGILGALLAVPTAAIIQVVIQELLDERDRRAEERLTRPAPALFSENK